MHVLLSVCLCVQQTKSNSPFVWKQGARTDSLSSLIFIWILCLRFCVFALAFSQIVASPKNKNKQQKQQQHKWKPIPKAHTQKKSWKCWTNERSKRKMYHCIFEYGKSKKKFYGLNNYCCCRRHTTNTNAPNGRVNLQPKLFCCTGGICHRCGQACVCTRAATTIIVSTIVVVIVFIWSLLPSPSPMLVCIHRTCTQPASYPSTEWEQQKVRHLLQHHSPGCVFAGCFIFLPRFERKRDIRNRQTRTRVGNGWNGVWEEKKTVAPSLTRVYRHGVGRTNDSSVYEHHETSVLMNDRSISRCSVGIVRQKQTAATGAIWVPHTEQRSQLGSHTAHRHILMCDVKNITIDSFSSARI